MVPDNSMSLTTRRILCGYGKEISMCRSMPVPILSFLLGLGFCSDARAGCCPCASDPPPPEHTVTIDCQPIGGTSVSGGEAIEVECLVTTDAEVTIAAYQLDLPCSLPGGPGPMGRIGSGGPSVDGHPGNPPVPSGDGTQQ